METSDHRPRVQVLGQVDIVFALILSIYYESIQFVRKSIDWPLTDRNVVINEYNKFHGVQHSIS